MVRHAPAAVDVRQARERKIAAGLGFADAERLEREVLALERGMERDGVRVRMVWAKDGCHDLLILAHWDEKVREGIWAAIHEWVREIENDP